MTGAEGDAAPERSEPVLDAAFVGRIELFAGLDAAHRERLAAGAVRRELAAGASVFRSGTPRQEYLRVVRGRIEVLRPTDGGEARALSSYGPDETLGEGVLLGETLHTTDGRAAVDSTLVAFPMETLAALFDADPRAEATVLRAALSLLTRRFEQELAIEQVEGQQFQRGRTRGEDDSLGTVQVPLAAYWGAQTQRALDNFRISTQRIYDFPDLVHALATVKLAAARANRECGVLEPRLALAIEGACEELRSGKLLRQFPLDVIQGGAGTSTNMNVNEVIANRASVALGGDKGDAGLVDAHDHVNRSQSTNDVYPTAIRLALARGQRRVEQALVGLAQSLARHAEQHRRSLKLGRTQLQDAVPMTVGQEFAAWSATVERERRALAEALPRLCEVNLGGTAIGTGLNAPPGYRERALAHLAGLTGLPIRGADDLIEASSDTQALVLYSAALKSVAVKLSKLANDLRLLSS
ncbi:MAG: lyase family protein, partial [Planctomycetota bacterium]